MCGCDSCCKSEVCRAIFYILGIICFFTGTVIYIVGFLSTSWVTRTLTNSNDSVSNFGIWTACEADSDCWSISEKFPDLGGAARGVQGLMTVTVILFILCFLGEVLCWLPCLPEWLTKTTIQQNHVLELIISITAVLGFLGILLFAGELKNKASREVGQQDSTGAGFSLVLAGELEIVLGCVLLACTRQAPEDTLDPLGESIEMVTHPATSPVHDGTK